MDSQDRVLRGDPARLVTVGSRVAIHEPRCECLQCGHLPLCFGGLCCNRYRSRSWPVPRRSERRHLIHRVAVGARDRARTRREHERAATITDNLNIMLSVLVDVLVHPVVTNRRAAVNHVIAQFVDVRMCPERRVNRGGAATQHLRSERFRVGTDVRVRAQCIRGTASSTPSNTRHQPATPNSARNWA